MKLHLIVLSICILELKGAKLGNKKTLKSNPRSAIIAIQIIDPHENKTSSKGSKRTIDSSLGYGYQTIFGGKQAPARYETYKYSQHDIPPYSGAPPTKYTNAVQSQGYDVQPSVSKQAYNADVSNYYQPGTVLFSTINQRGQLGGLSSQFPASLENHQFPIPVIILRVHPNQLANPVYPKLPENHFLASAINSIDINSLLSNHISNNVNQNPAPQYEPQYQQAQQTYAQPDATNYQTPDYQSQQYYPQVPQYQYEDTQQSNQQNYQEDQNYQPHQEKLNLPEPRSPELVSKFEVTQSAPVYEQHLPPVNDYRTSELLTHENYPSEKHTQVIFKRSKGKRRNANKSTRRPTRVQSTKSYLPEEVQVQHDETSDYNKKYSNPNAYNPAGAQSPQSSKSQAPPQENQIQYEKTSEYDSNKYAAPDSYYTNQYPQDQQYLYKNAPQYEEEQVADRYQNVQPVDQTQHYVYVSSRPKQHDSDV